MATKNLISSVTGNGSFSEGSKKTLLKMAEAIGEVSVLDASVVVTSTTLANIPGLPSYELRAGRKYLFKFNTQLTGTAADGGYQFKFNLTGTQTSAVFNGNCLFYNSDTGAAITATTSSFDASTVVATVAEANQPAKGRLEAWCLIIPQNDGKLTVQYANQAVSGSITVKRGAILEKIDLE